MKIYLAARYSRRQELCRYAEELRHDGYLVTSRWLEGDHEVGDEQLTDGTLEETEFQRFALEDWADVMAANVLISFTEPPRQGGGRGGRHVELGIALALDKQCLVVGYRENVFHWLPTVLFASSWQSARHLIAGLVTYAEAVS